MMNHWSDRNNRTKETDCYEKKSLEDRDENKTLIKQH